MEEIWKEASVEGYFVSNLGRIKGRSGKIMKLWRNEKKNPYLSVCIRLNGRGSKAKALKIHQEVAKAFIPNPENKPCINHIDGNKLNNTVTNLEWCTFSENTRHAFTTRLAKAKRGCDHPKSKLTKEQIVYIRNNYIPRDKTFGSRALSRKFGMSHTNILDIINNKTYII